MREETLVKNLLQYKRVLEGMLFAMTGDASAAEDLYQEMAILMTRKREAADEDCKFVAWGRQIAVNLVRDWRKKLARGKVQILDDDVLESVAGAFEASSESAWDARAEALRHCAEKLSEKDRTLLRRRYEQSVPVDQIAAELSISRGAVDTSLYRLRRALHDCVDMKLQQPGMS
ncbi:MAG: sigma-70 family RNA polymerase sigma factor [Planctomycetes bacterium]|nr:sigma-70 family RNA polymerase sigma factor [Planctomycetota bacterium]